MIANSIRVLLIDDHRSVLWGLEKLIDSQRPKMHVIGKFTSFAEASSSLTNLVPDIVLLDLDLGVECGTEVIPKLNAVSSAKIVILTGSRDETLIDKAVIAGARGILGKENPAETIISAIERVHNGELWVDRERMSRVFSRLTVGKEQDVQNPDSAKFESLTPKEKVIFKEMTSRAGASGNEIAKSIHISESTLRNHLTSIYSKLEIGNRLELWDFAQRLRSGKNWKD
jgi:two-component system, NarL family, nitrate/nitrite response regulator NarL